ncbi:MAG: hypothetical protein CMF74_10120 [Maricaulis sp.]|nr:hypothetical protein [Maricaulis sp.]
MAVVAEETQPVNKVLMVDLEEDLQMVNQLEDLVIHLLLLQHKELMVDLHRHLVVVEAVVAQLK